jgi:hypothetical protein
MSHPSDHHDDRADVGVLAASESDSLMFYSIFLLREEEAKVRSQFQQFQRYHVCDIGCGGNLEGDASQGEGVQIGICPDVFACA